MSQPLPSNIRTATYFVTLRLTDPHSDLLLRRIDTLRRAMRDTLVRHPLRIDAIAVLPSLFHALWTLPAGDPRCGRRVAALKTRFSRMQPMPADRSPAQIKRSEKGIWQRHTWIHPIRDVADFERHRDLIYLSPVHAGLCAQPQDWPHSSVHRDRRDGLGRPACFAPPPKPGRDLRHRPHGASVAKMVLE